MTDKNILSWLQAWYKDQCDGEWEHLYGLSIGTLDNPGWSVSIDIVDTKTKIPICDWQMIELESDNWYTYRITHTHFEGAGSPQNLENLLLKFKELVSLNEHSK